MILLISISQEAGITDVSHHAHLSKYYLYLKKEVNRYFLSKT
jgi:hypothetical protein